MIEALQLLGQGDSLLILITGTLLVMFSSFIPGMSSIGFASLALAISATWSTEHALILFGAITGGATFMGSVTAILFNVPGSASSSVALLDGYPIAAQGRPKLAISIAAASSAIGSLIGVVFMLLSLPWLSVLISLVGSFELTILILLGLMLILLLPSPSLFASLTSLLAGLLAATVGADMINGLPRLTFGLGFLYDGFAILPLMLGIFTLPELVKWLRPVHFNETVSAVPRPDDSVVAGLVMPLRHLPLVFKSALVGTIVGAIPGLGGPVAGYAAYGLAANKKGGTPAFGKGQVRGLIAPESAIDAKDGGVLIPTLSLGIPGSESCVILLAALALHGLQPGMDMLTRHLNMTYLLVFALVGSNLLTSCVGVLLAPGLARIRHIPLQRMLPWTLVIVMVCVSAYAGGLQGMVQLLGFFIVGFLCQRAKIPVVPFVVAFILGGMLERNTVITTQLISAGRIGSQLLMLFALACVVTIILAYCYRSLKRPRLSIAQQPDQQNEPSEAPALFCIGSMLSATGGFAVVQSVQMGLDALYFGIVASLALAQGTWVMLRAKHLCLKRRTVRAKSSLPASAIALTKSGALRLLCTLLGVIALQPVVGLNVALAAMFSGWLLLTEPRHTSATSSRASLVKVFVSAALMALLLGQTEVIMYDPMLNIGLAGQWFESLF